MLRADIMAAMKQAMKDKNQLRLSTLRLINAAIKDREIADRVNAGECADGAADPAVAELLAKMIKQRQDSASQYEDAGRLELADRENAEIAIIREFLPPALSDAEAADAVKDAIAKTGAASLKDMGAVMTALKADYAGRMDFGKAGKNVKAALSAS